jgi:hypothetical protein
VVRRVVTLGVLVALCAAASASARVTSAFKVTSPAGKSHSFGIVGYEFSSGLNPKLGVSGKIEVDVLIASKRQKAFLKKGTLKAATLHIIATLPKRINTTYRFTAPKITSVDFVTGHFGPVAAVDLSYKKLTS